MQSSGTRGSTPFSRLVSNYPSPIRNIKQHMRSRRPLQQANQDLQAAETVSEGKSWWSDPHHEHASSSNHGKRQEKLSAMTGSSVTVNNYGLADNIGMNGRTIDPEDRLPRQFWAAEPDRRDRVPGIRHAQSEPCLLTAYRTEKPLPNRPTELPASRAPQGEEADAQEHSAEPDLTVLEHTVTDQFAMHFDHAAMLTPKQERCGYDLGFPCLLKPGRVSSGVPEVRGRDREVELHFGSDTQTVGTTSDAYMKATRPRALSIGQKAQLLALEAPSWTRKAYLLPVEAQYSTYEPFLQQPASPKPSYRGLRRTSSGRKKREGMIVEAAGGPRPLSSVKEAYRISSGYHQPTEPLDVSLAPYMSEVQSMAVNQFTITSSVKQKPEVEPPLALATPKQEPKILPARAVAVRKVKVGEVSVRSLSKRLPRRHASKTRYTSPAPIPPAKQPFGWRRHADQDFTDPAEEHSERYKRKRKETNLRRKAAASAIQQETLVDVGARKPVSINLLDLQPEPAPPAAYASVDLLDSPIRENVRKSVLAPLSNVGSHIQMWELRASGT